MTQTLNPQHTMRDVAVSVFKWALTVHKALNGGVSLTNPVGKDSSGVYNTFEQANTDGVFIRIGSSSSSEAVKWTTNNTGVVIKHGLGRQPVGFQVADQDKVVSVFRTAVPDSNQITLAPTDATANVTVHIF